MKQLFGCTAVIGIALLAGMSPVSAAEWKILPGHVPEAAAGLTTKGELPSTNRLRMAIGLPLRNTVALEAFITQLYDPASSGYRQYLTQTEFTARFGPTVEDYEAVKNFARTNGLEIVATSDNRILLDVAGPVAAVEKAFHVKMRAYRHPTEARDFFAPDSEPTVAVQLPVVDVQGMSDFSLPQPKFARRTAALANPKTGSAPDSSGCYFGNDFRNAYVPGTTLTGAGQAIALFEADGFYAADISKYAAAAGNGRTNIVITTVLVDGFSGTPTTGKRSGNVEVSLDIEMAMAIAPGLTKIVVVEGNPKNYIPNDILNAMLATSGTVKNLSSSWGWSGGPSTTTDNIFTNMAAVGQSYFNASGDSCAFTAGSGSANGVDNAAIPNGPSSSPIITQVGGTTLTMNGTGASYASETVWNWGIEIGASEDGVGSSGGISSIYGIPSWQATVSGLVAAGGSTSFRNIPDVALTADNIYVTYGKGKVDDGIGGTSCAAPLWAGFIALVNQQAAANGLASVGFVNPALYNIATRPNYAACFHDVTTGNNTWSGSPSAFLAEPGYDLCTGLGTPGGISLINALSGVAAATDLMVSPLTNMASGLAGGPFSGGSVNFQLSNSTAASLNWSLISAPVWLAFSSTNGTLVAGGQTTVAANLNSAATNLSAGAYAATLTFSNSTAHTTQATLFTLLVSQPMTLLPTNGFTTTGPIGGPFNVTSQNYSLTNESASPLAWAIVSPAAWLGASPANGVIPAGGQAPVTISLTSMASNLSFGVYTANLQVTNSAGGAATLAFTLNAGLSIVSNGGFETGNFSGWTLNASSSIDLVTNIATLVHSGNFGAALGETNGLGTLSQNLTTIPGQSYLLNLWLENPANSTGATPNQFVVQWNGTTLYSATNLPFVAWTNLQFVVTATVTATVLQFGFEDTPYYLGLDDIAVTAVSLPAFKTAQPGPSAFNLSWNAVAGLTYQVQFNTNLAQTNWINLGGPQAATNGTINFTDTSAFNSSPAGFYRIIVLP